MESFHCQKFSRGEHVKSVPDFSLFSKKRTNVSMLTLLLFIKFTNKSALIVLRLRLTTAVSSFRIMCQLVENLGLSSASIDHKELNLLYVVFTFAQLASNPYFLLRTLRDFSALRQDKVPTNCSIRDVELCCRCVNVFAFILSASAAALFFVYHVT